jgi:hypothetical protein
VLLLWIPGATSDDDTLVCHRVGDEPRAAKGELLGRVAVAARDGRRLPIAGTLSALTRQLTPMVALPVLRMAGR